MGIESGDTQWSVPPQERIGDIAGHPGVAGNAPDARFAAEMELIMGVLRDRASELATLAAAGGLSPHAAFHLEQFRESLYRNCLGSRARMPGPAAGVEGSAAVPEPG
ncbi:MAG: hypothetical protein ABW278_14715 [Steroidobacteraceae bacterium]